MIFKKQTVKELADEYMQAYYRELDISGEHSAKSQGHKACWDLFSSISRRLRYSKDLVPKLDYKKQNKLKDLCTKYVHMLLDIFKST